MFIILVVVFVLGYIAIALEHPIKVEKAASALLIGSILWALYALFSEQILALGFSPSWEEIKLSAQTIIQNIKPVMDPDRFATSPFRETVDLAANTHAFVKEELAHHLVDIAEILFFLFGAMTIVEVVDQHQGFTVITDKIRTTNQVKLIWIIGFITFFMSAVLDNLTTTIVMIALLRKLISDKHTRWTYASMIVIAANAGGAWSPIGDVTTIMLWIGGQITTVNIMLKVFLPSLVSMIVPLAILSFMVSGNVKRPERSQSIAELTTPGERLFILILGVSALLFVPVFKTITHLPPYVGMLFGLSILWIVSEIMHRNKEDEVRKKLTIFYIVKRVDTPTIFFFLGILSAVAALQSAGQLSLLAGWFNDKLGNIYLINIAIGGISAVVDNVPLVAGAMGMYDIVTPDMLRVAVDPAYAGFFTQDGLFWEFLAYCAGTGGSMLIIGSAAGVAAMGLERIDFIWYMKRISLLALAGYLAGAGIYWLQAQILA
ncbi:MAG TPA: sodium:proton antiporter NhaD [Bacteroidales bacterium]|nr:sodium:proton antiporter NhaD [Bacteroidales bacterium]